MSQFERTRRDFLKTVVLAGVSVCFAPIAGLAGQQFSFLHQSRKTWAAEGKANYRFDAIQKVTGEKIFGRDFRARDFEHWPDQQWHGYVLCATRTDRLFESINLDFLEQPPSRIILASDLKEQNIELPAFHGQDMLLPAGQVAQFFGHPVAILLFEQFDTFNAAKSRLEFNPDAVRYGATATPFERDPYASWRVVRVAADRTDGVDEFSPFQDGLFFPAYQLRQPKWPGPPNVDGTLGERGMYYAERIRQQSQDAKLHVVEKNFQTQIVEPMMLEPEAANLWFDSDTSTMHGILTCQDPTDFAEMAVHMIKASQPGRDVKNMVVYSGFVGGGFGAKDHSVFPYYALAASLFTGGKPVRIANDRYQQFQQGLKRHPFKIHNRMVINPENLKIEGLISEMAVDGGGRQNFSPSVASAGMSAMQGVFYIPQSDLQATAYYSPNVSSGSMRGYGSTQAMPLIDLMLAQAAHELGVDPFELRRRNLLHTNDLNTQGVKVDGELRYQEMLDKAEKHPIWRDRKANKQAYEAEHPNKSFGVGYSLLAKNYGTGNVGPNAAVNLTESGEIVLEIEYMEMGSGAQTSQGLLTHEFFGSAADVVHVSVTETWKALQLFETDNPYTISQEKQDLMSKDPLWTPVKLMASSASDSATFQTEATRGACAVVWRHGIVPAARLLWGLDAGADISQASWESGQLMLEGQDALELSRLARTAHEQGFITGCVAHTVNRWSWTEAEFTIDGNTRVHSLDALAVRYGSGASAARKQLMDSLGYHLIKRNWVKYPSTRYNNAMVTYYAPCDCLVEIAVDHYSGQVEIIKTHTVLDAGPLISEPIVTGQIEGGLAMGVGHVLHEYLPPGTDGAGNGTWNLNRYRVPMASDLPVWNMTSETLPPKNNSERPKGIAEVVMLPVISAIQDALFDAIGERFDSTPITAEQIRQRLRT